MNLSPSAFSRLINRLESQAGVQLFDRQGHDISLTEEGTKFVTFAKKCLAEKDELLEEFVIFLETMANKQFWKLRKRAKNFAKHFAKIDNVPADELYYIRLRELAYSKSNYVVVDYCNQHFKNMASIYSALNDPYGSAHFKSLIY